MKYVVLRYFTDAQDNEYAYNEGDIYPRKGLTVSDARIKDLLSGNNFQRIALIKRVTEDEIAKSQPKKEEEAKEITWTEEDINKMPFMKLKSIAKKNGIEVEDRKAEEIRSDLIEKLVEV